MVVNNIFFVAIFFQLNAAKVLVGKESKVCTYSIVVKCLAHNYIPTYMCKRRLGVLIPRQKFTS